MKQTVRLQKYLAQAGLGSRRSSERLILAGRVAINGQVCETLGTTIDPETDTVTLDGNRVLMPDEKKYILLNKPEGYMVSRSDPHQPKTIYTLLPQEFESLHPVGRLDQNSCGLLLLTNDGELTEKLLHPRFKLEKVYKVQVKGKATDLALNYLRTGVDLSDGKTQPARVVRLKQRSENTWIEFGLKEGRNRQIRRMCRSVGLDVITLQRTAFGPLLLGTLPLGAWRELTEQEIQTLIKKTKVKAEKPSRSSNPKTGAAKSASTDKDETPLDWKPGPRTGAKKDGPRSEKTQGPKRAARPAQGESQAKRSPDSERSRAAFSTRARSASAHKPSGYTPNRSQEDASDHPRTYASPRSRSSSSDKRQGYSADKSPRYSSEHSPSEVTDKPRGYTSGRSRSSDSDKSQRYSSERPRSSAKPKGRASESGRSEGADKPRGLAGRKPRAYAPDAARGRAHKGRSNKGPKRGT